MNDPWEDRVIAEAERFEKIYGTCLTDCDDNPDHGALIGDAKRLVDVIFGRPGSERVIEPFSIDHIAIILAKVHERQLERAGLSPPDSRPPSARDGKTRTTRPRKRAAARPP
jgi:hypothetical protein